MPLTESNRVVKNLKTPRAAAIAGILFAVLMGTTIILIRNSTALNLAEAGRWLVDGGRRTAVTIAVNLIPFAGIAFLWFMGVMRDRLGEQEDRFFATVFLGSGLLFVAMLFVTAAIALGLLAHFHTAPHKAAQSEIWTFGRQITLAMLNVFAARMAAVFMISMCTIALRTAFVNRWLAYLGLAIALVLLVGSGRVAYIYLLFPLWILLVSIDALIRSLRGNREQSAPGLES
jgi:hypothetical protein